jgi:hypothetical protein
MAEAVPAAAAPRHVHEPALGGQGLGGLDQAYAAG